MNLDYRLAGIAVNAGPLALWERVRVRAEWFIAGVLVNLQFAICNFQFAIVVARIALTPGPSPNGRGETRTVQTYASHGMGEWSSGK